MSVNRLPTGVSVIQAKKDAKRLANKSEISLAQAQNEVALKHGRADWPTLMNQLKTQNDLSVTLQQSFLNKVTLDFPENKSLNIVVGQSGSGKSLLLLEFAAQWLQKGFPVIYLGADVANAEKIPTQFHGAIATRFLSSKYPDLFKTIAISTFDKEFSLDDLMLDGAVLIVDEIDLMLDGAFLTADEILHMVNTEMNSITVQKMHKLINCSMHTFLGLQVLVEKQEIISNLKNVTDDNTRLIILKGSVPDIYEYTPFEYDRQVMTEEVEQLEQIRNKYTEFLFIEKDSYQKLRFRLSDHHAL